jgi:hypothetical protein
VIYADPSFLCSLYGWDGNTGTAQATFARDARRPLFYTPWQRLEVRNAVRLAVFKLQRAGRIVPFQPGNVFKRINADLAQGRLRQVSPDWEQTGNLAEDLSDEHTVALGASAIDLWHVAAALLLDADTFWTFDATQYEVARAVGTIRHVPKLPTA